MTNEIDINAIIDELDQIWTHIGKVEVISIKASTNASIVVAKLRAIEQKLMRLESEIDDIHMKAQVAARK